MVRASRFRAICSALGGVEERPHFDRAAFRTPARTFATLGPSGEDVNVLLPLEVQLVLVDSQPEVFARLQGGWGARGWTRMDLPRVDEATCREVLREAHAYAAPKPKKKAAAQTKAKAKAR
jgi:hypothetical protein